ncbi:MAG: hypothetical protein Q7O66_22055 [Dehalococcoidia bacterium]|nr:hypothetical protein [Dehalococcoidia bacterium]
MALRGKAAIVGFAELPSVRSHPGRTAASLMAETSAMAIQDAGLRKEQIDGLITHNQAALDGVRLAEYMRVKPKFCEAVTTHGASGAYSIELAAMVIDAGIANYVLCTLGGTTDRELGGYRIG